MPINVCLASRGRPQLAALTIERLSSLAVLPDTTISVALDSDDSFLPDYSATSHDRLKVSVAPREDSLGAKYNRCVIPDRTNVLWADDVTTTTKGWDEKIESAASMFMDGMGIIYFGKIEGVMQPGIAVTPKMIEAMGFFCVPYFPFWWHDTWTDEIGRMCDRIITVDIAMELLQPLEKKSRGVREIEFWAKFFDDLRPQRRSVAENVIRKGDDQPYRKIQLLSRIRSVEQMVNQRNSILRNPEDAKRLELHYGFENTEMDERYVRSKNAATEMLKKLEAA